MNAQRRHRPKEITNKLTGENEIINGGTHWFQLDFQAYLFYSIEHLLVCGLEKREVKNVIVCRRRHNQYTRNMRIKNNVEQWNGSVFIFGLASSIDDNEIKILTIYKLCSFPKHTEVNLTTFFFPRQTLSHCTATEHTDLFQINDDLNG